MLRKYRYLYVLLPTLAILLGVAVATLRPKESLRSGALFSVLCLAVYLAALVAHYLNTPSWCATKAFYALGAMPCLVFLFATGIQLLIWRPWMRVPVYALLACRAVSSYAGYFVTQ